MAQQPEHIPTSLTPSMFTGLSVESRSNGGVLDQPWLCVEDKIIASLYPAYRVGDTGCSEARFFAQNFGSLLMEVAEAMKGKAEDDSQRDLYKELTTCPPDEFEARLVRRALLVTLEEADVHRRIAKKTRARAA